MTEQMAAILLNLTMLRSSVYNVLTEI